MRHRNKVRQLGRTHSHRKAMFSNMVTSLFNHEKIVTTKQKGKELKKISEKLITRAKRNLDLPPDDIAGRLHNKREVMKVVKDRDVVRKLFEDIAPRFKERNGGYTRQLLLGRRPGDAAEMSIVELVERKREPVKEETKDEKKPGKKAKVKDDAPKKEEKKQADKKVKEKDEAVNQEKVDDKKPAKKEKEKSEAKEEKKSKKEKKESKEKK